VADTVAVAVAVRAEEADLAGVEVEVAETLEEAQADATSAALEVEGTLADAISAEAAILEALETAAFRSAMVAAAPRETPAKPSREGPDLPALHVENPLAGRHLRLI
jgi:hypothetical protein